MKSSINGQFLLDSRIRQYPAAAGFLLAGSIRGSMWPSGF